MIVIIIIIIIISVNNIIIIIIIISIIYQMFNIDIYYDSLFCVLIQYLHYNHILQMMTLKNNIP